MIINKDLFYAAHQDVCPGGATTAPPRWSPRDPNPLSFILFLPVLLRPMLFPNPLSPCKLTQLLWTLAACFLIGSPRINLSSDKTKRLHSYTAPS